MISIPAPLHSAPFSPADVDDYQHLATLYQDNPRLAAAGWTFDAFIAAPETALRAVIWADPAPRPDPAPLLPAQALAAWDQAHRDALALEAAAAAIDLEDAWSEHLAPWPVPTGPRHVGLRDGALTEPLTHRTRERAKRRPWPRVLAKLIWRRAWQWI